MRLKNKVAIVTGSGKGIGEGIALCFAEEGAKVVVNDLNEPDARRTVDTIKNKGGQAVAVVGNVASRDVAQKMADVAVKEFGTVDILVNNAGIARLQPLDEIRQEDWDESIAVNLTSAFLTTQAVLPYMRKQKWGRIINISSVAAQTGGVVGPHYAASKAGLIGLTHSYASLLAKEGITANAIAPALIATEMVRNNPRARPDLLPVGRFGTVQEVVDTVVFLALNGYMTGQTISPNGGWYMT
ncbi:MAG: 3-oxoacyl-ACP reductase FabG [Deltaproteobacteria bacterium]|jgi:3-oxoacyl-[acyl-carrier protein] reductase|nr:3-oxoacyl-ACP reductase FabG [Deltaproteobacteria bacterium]